MSIGVEFWFYWWGFLEWDTPASAQARPYSEGAWRVFLEQVWVGKLHLRG